MVPLPSASFTARVFSAETVGDAINGVGEDLAVHLQNLVVARGD